MSTFLLKTQIYFITLFSFFNIYFFVGYLPRIKMNALWLVSQCISHIHRKGYYGVIDVNQYIFLYIVG